MESVGSDNVESKDVERMEEALRILGYSYHSGTPRYGPKAQVARWGLGEDTYPVGYGPYHDKPA